MVAADEVEVTYEVFSLPISEAAKLRRKKLGGGKSYLKILELLKNKEARQETWMSVKMQNGTSTILKETEEFIYQSEMTYPELPSMIGSDFLQRHPLNPFPIPRTATSYDTKLTGDILELNLREDGNSLRLGLTATRAGLIRIDLFGKETTEVEMPRFAVQNLKTEIAVTRGKTTLVGTISPPRDLQKAKEKRVWLAFVTVK